MRWLTALLLAGCTVEVDYSQSQYLCPEENPQCPPDHLCVAGRCIPRVDAPPADAGFDADPTLCGNGDLDTGEECDDQNDLDTDGCVSCRIARCGDGHVRTPVEECDDGNNDTGDLCNPICRECTAGAARFTWPGNDACYQRFDEAGLSWATANNRCGASGAHLAVFETASESDAIAAGLSVSSGHWIGMTDADVEDTWVWLTGLVLGADDDWADPEPDGATVENCGFMNSAGDWADVSCSANASVVGYLCEDDGWIIGPDGHAYRYLYQPASWTIARDACVALGGHLATLTTTEENALVAGPARTETFVGGSDLASEGDFVWVGSEPWGFTSWATGEPDDVSAVENCLSVEGGQWFDSDCDEPRPYICEVE